MGVLSSVHQGVLRLHMGFFIWNWTPWAPKGMGSPGSSGPDAVCGWNRSSLAAPLNAERWQAALSSDRPCSQEQDATAFHHQRGSIIYKYIFYREMDWMRERKICHWNPGTHYTKVHYFTEVQAYALQAQTCFKSLLTERRRVDACMGYVMIYQEICRLVPAFTKAPNEVHAGCCFTLNRGLAWERQQRTALLCNFLTYLFK